MQSHAAPTQREDRASPAPGGRPAWGSDLIAEALSATGVTHIALTPGSSFRGLHDSLVNHLGSRGPEILLCLHEEHCVAIAHGYAKVTEQPMAVAVHSNVGLMHASMAIYNAYCDRIPMLVVGATGPVDAARRRPWIDWIHTSADQAMIVRPYLKWDDQPASVGASVDSVLHANRVTRTHPQAPVYVCLDVSVQEEPVTSAAEPPPAARIAPVPDAVPDPAAVDRAAALLTAAARPVVLIGRVGRSTADWARRIRLVEHLGARVITDAKLPSAFPTDHPQHAGAPAIFLGEANGELLRRADVVLALDWCDLAGTLRSAGATHSTIISAGVDHQLHNGWSKDSFGSAPVDLALPCRADVAIAALLRHVPPDGEPAATHTADTGGAACALPDPPGSADMITVPALERALHDATLGTQPCLIRTPLSWDGRYWPQRGPLDVLGHDGGAGLGSGPGMAVGAALALRGTGRLPVAVLGDGDLLMGGTALWTASKHDIPLLVVVANNTSFYNDEVHQRNIAIARGRPTRNASIGVALDEPSADLAGFARSLGFTGFGPVSSRGDLPTKLARAVETVQAGGRALIDVRVEPGYAADMTEALTKD